MNLSSVTASRVERWSDARLQQEVREVYARLAFFGVGDWRKLPVAEAKRAFVVRNEALRRFAQLRIF